MEFLGIGPLELLAILLLIFVVMGPGDMVRMAGTLGRALRTLRQSEFWRALQQASRELRSLPDSLARQAGMDEIQKISSDVQEKLGESRAELQDLDRQFLAWTRKPASPKEAREPDESPSAPKPEDG